MKKKRTNSAHAAPQQPSQGERTPAPAPLVDHAARERELRYEAAIRSASQQRNDANDKILQRDAVIAVLQDQLQRVTLERDALKRQVDKLTVTEKPTAAVAAGPNGEAKDAHPVQ